MAKESAQKWIVYENKFGLKYRIGTVRGRTKESALKNAQTRFKRTDIEIKAQYNG